MNFLKELVSGPKNRYLQNGFNLDLTYVTNRIIAMAYPASGYEKLYRNSIDQVSQFIKEQHGSNFLIINLSNRHYDYSKLLNQVIDYDWEDHHSPPIHTLFLICREIDKFLKKNPENVIFVHCLAGKGRTGTIICCYLLYCGRFNDPNEVMYYYSVKRFKKKGLGVNQPCQVRYLKYFWQVLNQGKIYPSQHYIKQIKLIERPNYSDGGCKPFFQVIQVRKKQIFYTTKDYKDNKFLKDQNQKTIIFERIVPLLGDILIQMKHSATLKNETMAYFSLNSSFFPLIEESPNKIILTLSDLSPYATFKNKKFPRNFKIEIEYANICKKCTYKTKINEQCAECQQILNTENNYWQETYQLLKSYKRPSLTESKIICFGQNDYQKDDDVDKILKEIQQIVVAQGSSQPESLEEYISELHRRGSELLSYKSMSPITPFIRPSKNTLNIPRNKNTTLTHNLQEIQEEDDQFFTQQQSSPNLMPIKQEIRIRTQNIILSDQKNKVSKKSPSKDDSYIRQRSMGQNNIFNNEFSFQDQVLVRNKSISEGEQLQKNQQNEQLEQQQQQQLQQLTELNLLSLQKEQDDIRLIKFSSINQSENQSQIDSEINKNYIRNNQNSQFLLNFDDQYQQQSDLISNQFIEKFKNVNLSCDSLDSQDYYQNNSNNNNDNNNKQIEENSQNCQNNINNQVQINKQNKNQQRQSISDYQDVSDQILHTLAYQHKDGLIYFDE